MASDTKSEPDPEKEREAWGGETKLDPFPTKQTESDPGQAESDPPPSNESKDDSVLYGYFQRFQAGLRNVQPREMATRDQKSALANQVIELHHTVQTLNWKLEQLEFRLDGRTAYPPRVEENNAPPENLKAIARRIKEHHDDIMLLLKSRSAEMEQRRDIKRGIDELRYWREYQTEHGFNDLPKNFKNMIEWKQDTDFNMESLVEGCHRMDNEVRRLSKWTKSTSKELEKINEELEEANEAIKAINIRLAFCLIVWVCFKLISWIFL